MVSLNILNKSFDVAFQNPIERTISKLELLLDEDKGESINSRVLHFNNFKNFLGEMCYLVMALVLMD